MYQNIHNHDHLATNPEANDTYPTMTHNLQSGHTTETVKQPFEMYLSSRDLAWEITDWEHGRRKTPVLK